MSLGIRSDKARMLYSYSAWAVVCTGGFMIFMLTPWFQQIEVVPDADLLLRVLVAPLALVAAPATFVIWFGMAAFCMRRDRSPVSAKILWFVLFLATGPFGSAAYYFRVYRRQMRDARPLASQGGGLMADWPAGSTETPAQHDLITGTSKRAIAEPAGGDELKKIPSFFLRAKHWQIFPWLVALPIFLEILGLGMMSRSVSSWHDLTARDYLVMVTWELVLLCVLAWLGSMGLFLRSIERPELRMRTKLLNISIITAALYAVTYVPSQVCKTSAFTRIVESLSPLWLVGVLYIVYFVSKNLVMAERGTPVSFDQYVGLFFLLWFFPIGVWIIQPKINRLFRNQVARDKQGPSR